MDRSIPTSKHNRAHTRAGQRNKRENTINCTGAPLYNREPDFVVGHDSFPKVGVGHQNERTVRPMGPDGPRVPRLD
jgi:hypothetical protein